MRNMNILITVRETRTLRKGVRVDVTILEANAPVADCVTKILVAKGVKQKAVAARAGYTDQALSDMLNGRKLMKPSDIARLARALDSTPNELFGIADTKPPQTA